MRSRTVAIAMLLLPACNAPRDTPPAADRTAAGVIDRRVRVNDTVIELGKPLPASLASAAAGARDTIITLASGLLPSAERASVRLTTTGVVSAVVIFYAHAVDYDSMVADLTAKHGAAHRSRPRRDGEEPADLAVWRDATTEFELLRDPNRSAWTVRGTLLDVASAPPSP